MKSLFLFVLIIFSFTASATNYYISNSGNDANNGTDPSTPWKTIDRLNSFNGLMPGDQILFNRGDVFHGTINVNKSGNLGNPIIYGAYGSGPKPIISGFETLSNWTSYSNMIQKCPLNLNGNNHLEIVTINGNPQGRGRWPNTGFRTYTSSVSQSSITDPALTSSPDWTGAEVVMRKTAWTLDRNYITRHSGNTLNFTAGSSWETMTSNYGYFIQNSLSTLDAMGEWFYDGTNMYMYFGSSNPSTYTVKASVRTRLINVDTKNNLTFDNLSIEGADSIGVYLVNSGYITIQNCDFNYSGKFGVQAGWQAHDITVDHCSFNNSYANAMWLGGTTGDLVKNNIVKNTGIIMGTGTSGVSGDYDNNGDGIVLYTTNSTIETNTVDSCGHSGIRFGGTYDIIKNNYVINIGVVRNDVGGIYAYSDGPMTGSQIFNNIVLHALGNKSGMPPGTEFVGAEGIYLDYVSGISIIGNTTGYSECYGYLINGSQDIEMHDNTSYDAKNAGIQINERPTDLARHINMSRNKFIAKSLSDPSLDNVNSAALMFYSDAQSTVPDFGNVDSNYYARPIDDNVVMPVYTGTWVSKNLDGWKMYSGKDAHSLGSPKHITSTDSLTFLTNPSNSSRTFTLPYRCIDITGAVFDGTITLAPFKTAVLIRDGSIADTASNVLVVNAGADQTVTLPLDSVNLSGIINDAGGKIVSYLWSKLSGPAATISDSSVLSTNVKGLVQGGYQFLLSVVDDRGAIGNDTVMVTVNAEPTTTRVNTAPVSNAGPDKTITLPTDSIQLSGSGTDADGTVSSYLWKKISGPVATIADSSSAVSSVKDLVQGIYQFALTVTDNKGAVGIDTVTITVNAPTITVANKPPTANAGSDQNITIPNNNAKLVGSGSDSDGRVVSYLWTKISGPSQGSLTNYSSASTPFKGLVAGIYEFELTVTDDKGATGKDTVRIIVNSTKTNAINILPVANAGPDISIKLPTNSIQLSGNGVDSDGTISSYLWSQISGASAIVSDGTTSTATVQGLVEGIYEFQLTVTDDKGEVGKDTVKVTVSSVATTTATNRVPIANGGADKNITLPTNSIQLSGSGSDLDGTISSYEWIKISGPSSFALVNSSSSVITINNMVEGVYQFQLTVTDDRGAVGKDTVKVTVNAAITSSVSNKSPIANAGSDQMLTLPTNSATVNGYGVDSDGTISSYSWTKISGPLSYNISNPASSSTLISNMEEGVYEFQLAIHDDKGAVGYDTLRITISPSIATNTPANQPPIADAGYDLTTVSSATSVNLNGSGTDKDGKIASYYWQQLSGPSTSNIVDPNSATTTVENLTGGTYEFELTITDNSGAISRDTMKVTVALERIAPKTGKLSVYPNPVHDIANVEATAPELNTNVSIIITDMSGTIVLRREFVSNSTQVKQEIDMSNQVKGVYVVTIFFDGTQQQSVKIIRL